MYPIYDSDGLTVIESCQTSGKYMSAHYQTCSSTSLKVRRPGNKIRQMAVTQATGYDFGNGQTF